MSPPARAPPLPIQIRYLIFAEARGSLRLMMQLQGLL